MENQKLSLGWKRTGLAFLFFFFFWGWLSQGLQHSWDPFIPSWIIWMKLFSLIVQSAVFTLIFAQSIYSIKKSIFKQSDKIERWWIVKGTFSRFFLYLVVGLGLVFTYLYVKPPTGHPAILAYFFFPLLVLVTSFVLAVFLFAIPAVYLKKFVGNEKVLRRTFIFFVCATVFLAYLFLGESFLPGLRF